MVVLGLYKVIFWEQIVSVGCLCSSVALFCFGFLMERKDMNLSEKLSECAVRARNAETLAVAKKAIKDYYDYMKFFTMYHSYKVWQVVAFIQYKWTDIERNVTWVITKIIDDKKLWYSFFLWEERFYKDELYDIQIYFS